MSVHKRCYQLLLTTLCFCFSACTSADARVTMSRNTRQPYPIDIADTRPIYTNGAANVPIPQGPYSQAVRVGQFVFISGQNGISPSSQTLVKGGIIPEAKQAFTNLQQACQQGGTDVSKILQLTVYLVNTFDANKVNEVMKSFMKPPYPASTLVTVADLPNNAAIMLQATAYAN